MKIRQNAQAEAKVNASRRTKTDATQLKQAPNQVAKKATGRTYSAAEVEAKETVASSKRKNQDVTKHDSKRRKSVEPLKAENKRRPGHAMLTRRALAAKKEAVKSRPKPRNVLKCPVKLTKELIRSQYEESTMSGNSDDEGSVQSGVLDEDICFECGKSTVEDDDWTQLYMCDSCDGEYHLRCVGLDRPPRKESKFYCPKCVQDSLVFHKMKFSVVVPDGSFKIPRWKRSTDPISICYSPSRPLDLAWEECTRKGFMVVQKVFDHKLMRVLTHGSLTKTTLSGRVAETWSGAMEEMAKKMRESGRNVVNRGGRFDIKVPDFVVDQLCIQQKLEPILSLLRGIMGQHPRPELRTHNIVFAPVGSAAQEWHCDDSFTQGKSHRYFTILIHLNPLDSLCGGTEIWSRHLKRSDMIRARPGDAFVFNGSLMHRGQANSGYSHRFFYYASFACRSDANTDL